MDRDSLARYVRQLVAGIRRPALVGASGGFGRATVTLPFPGAPRQTREGGGTAAEKRAYRSHVDDASHLVAHGRPATAIVLTRETSDRRFNGAQIVIVTLEIDDPAAPESRRTIVYEHLFGPASARRWKPGHEIQIWIDPRDPMRIYAGR